MTTGAQELSDLGVSIWLDDLSRDRIASGDLAQLIRDSNVVGITTNPTIFANALRGSSAYEGQIRELASHNVTADEVALTLTVDDVVAAADILHPTFVATGGRDGWVSIEVGASVARDAAATMTEIEVLRARTARPNVFVKVPATSEGVEAIAAATAKGISINVTLIFSLDRYRQVIDAYFTGLEQAHLAGLDLGAIRSVASFFVSRVDGAVDAALTAVGTAEALSLRGEAGVANARLAYEIYRQALASERWQRLSKFGANPQRPLWASTGVKNPATPDTYYVVELVASDVINTMPEKTLHAVVDHAHLRGDTITGAYDQARDTLHQIATLGVDLPSLTETLEREGVEKFIASGKELVATVQAAMSAVR